MIDLGLLTALGRSNITEFKKANKGVENTLYLDYDNRIGYIWDNDRNNYIEIFNGNLTNGLTFKSIYDSTTNSPDLNSVDKHVGDFWICTSGDWLVWNGSTFYRIDNGDVDNGVIKVNNSKELTILNCTYLVDTSYGDIVLIIPYSTDANKDDYVKIIKCSDDANKVIITQERNDSKYYLYDKNDLLGFISSGNITDDWVVSDSNRPSEPLNHIELGGESKTDNNWRIVPNGSDLQLQRYFKGEPTTIATIGQGIQSCKYTLKNTAGKISFRNAGGKTRTLMSPSKDTNGVAVGNPCGRISLLNSGELYNISFNQDEKVNVINSSYLKRDTGSKFSYKFKSTMIQAIRNGTIRLDNVPTDTRIRFIIQDTSGNVLEESINKYDFESDVVKGGQVVTNGENILSLLEEVVIPSDYQFVLTFYFSNNVELMGNNIDMADGLGVRFIPTFKYAYLYGTPSYIASNDNIKSIIGNLVDTNRVDAYSIYNGMFVTSNDLSASKEHVNHTILFTHASGMARFNIETDGIFKQGDKVTIYAKYSNVIFKDYTTTDVVEVKRDEVYVLQKSHDNWCVINKYVGEGYGNKAYYFTSEINTLTNQMIKSNIDRYDYRVDWNIGENYVDLTVDELGQYYVYCILPTCFVVDGYDYKSNVVLNGISYDIFVSKSKVNFTNATEMVRLEIQTDALAYTTIPSDGELLIGDGTQVGIKGCGIKSDDVAIKHGCLARRLNGLQEIQSNTDTIAMFNTTDESLSYNPDSVGIDYLDGVFTNITKSTIVCTVSYQIDPVDTVSSWINNGIRHQTNVMVLTIPSGGTFSIYCNNASLQSAYIASSIQIVRII